MLDPVLLTKLHRIHAEFSGKFVDNALDGEGCFRTSGTAVGIGWRLVRVNTSALEVQCFHLVDAGVHEHAEQRRTRGDDLQVRTHVGEQVNLHAQDLTVAGCGDLDVLNLVAAMVHREDALATGLGPLDRTTQLLGEQHRENFLAVDLQLATETATYVWCHDAQVVLRNSGE